MRSDQGGSQRAQQQYVQPSRPVRPQRVARRGDVPAFPRRPHCGGPGVARLLRRLPAGRRGHCADAATARRRRRQQAPAEQSVAEKAVTATKPVTQKAAPGDGRRSGPDRARRTATAPVAAPARPAPEKPAAGSASKAARPAPAGRGGHDDAVARCRVDGREEHGGVAGGADGDVGAGGAGEAAGRQPPGDQQPAAADARREDLLHPPHRVRRRAGAGRVPGDEPALHRDRRPPDGGHPGPRQPRPGDRPARQERAAVAGRGVDQGLRGDELRAVLVGLRGDRAQGPHRRAEGRRLRGHHAHV